MAVTHTNTSPLYVRDQMCNLVVDLLDAGTTNTYPRLVFRDASNNALCTMNFTGTTAFKTAGTGTGSAQANNIATGTVTADGTCSRFALQDQDARTILTGTVTVQGGGGDIELSSVDFNINDTVDVSNLVYSSAA